MNNTICELNKKNCVPCEGGVPALSQEEATKLLGQLQEWKLQNNPLHLSKNFNFSNFYQTMAFVNAVAWIANQENHHPDLEIGYNYCCVNYHTHAINGLSENDFICAAKIDQLNHS